MSSARRGFAGARLRSLWSAVAPILCCLAGLLYPLAGIILYVVFRVRGSDATLRRAPLIGAAVSMLVYVVSFVAGAMMVG